jgi:hypothetical protein
MAAMSFTIVLLLDMVNAQLSYECNKHDLQKRLYNI